VDGGSLVVASIPIIGALWIAFMLAILPGEKPKRKPPWD
jgi:hypothetical protein